MHSPPPVNLHCKHSWWSVPTGKNSHTIWKHCIRRISYIKSPDSLALRGQCASSFPVVNWETVSERPMSLIILLRQRSYDLSSSNAFPHLPNAQQQQRSSSSTQQYRTASWPLHTTAAAAAAAAPRFGGERKRWQEGFEQDDPLLPIHTTRPYGFRRSLSQSTRAAPEIRICSKCHTSTSPEWRKGPSGNKT